MRLHKIKMAFAGAVAVAALACTSATASAHKTVLKAKAPIQGLNEYCGEDRTELSTIGTATYRRVGNVVSAVYKLKRGLPDTTYYVSLWEQLEGGENREEIGALAEFTTNRKGAGSGAGKIVVLAGDTTFFATGLTIEPYFGYNNSVAVELAEKD